MVVCCGIKLRFHWSVFFLLALIAYSLAAGVFPKVAPGASTVLTWALGLLTAIIFLSTIAVHELAHSLVSTQIFGIRIRGVAFFLFGGAASWEDDVTSPGAEFCIAVAGPLTSAALGGCFIGLALLIFHNTKSLSSEGKLAITACEWLGWMNIILAAFNLIPAFPLDGGRMLRSALWKCLGSKPRATRIAAALGIGFGIFLSLYGFANLLMGRGLDGLWLVFLGSLLVAAAWSEKQVSSMNEAFKDVKLLQIMSSPVIAVPAGTTVEEFLTDYVRVHKRVHFPVLVGDSPVGMIDLASTASVPQELQRTVLVSDLVTSLEEAGVAMVDKDSSVALALPNLLRVGRVLVVENLGGGRPPRLVGIASNSDLALAMALGVNDHRQQGLMAHPSRPSLGLRVTPGSPSTTQAFEEARASAGGVCPIDPVLDETTGASRSVDGRLPSFPALVADTRPRSKSTNGYGSIV